MKQVFPAILLLICATSAPAFAKGKIEEGQREKSCILEKDSSPALLNLGSSGLEKETIKVVEGPYGPELRIGKAKIFLNGKSTKNNDKDGKTGELNNRWCIIDPDLNKKRKAESTKEAECDDLSPLSKTDKKDPIVIQTDSGPVKIQAKYNEQTKGVELFFDVANRNHSGANPKNQLVLSGAAVEKGKTTVSSLRVESRGYTSGTVNGVLESQVEGFYGDGENSDKDPTASLKFKKCKSLNEAKGQLRTSEDGAPITAVDLSGSHIIMRGTEKYGIDQFKAKDHKNQPEYMNKGEGRN